MTQTNNTAATQTVTAIITTTQTWKGKPLTFDFTYDVQPGGDYMTRLVAVYGNKNNPVVLKYANTSNIEFFVK